MKFRHPSMRKLQGWLDGEQDKLDDHLATCTVCASRLEPLLDESEALIRTALLELLSVPAELPDRLQRTIDERLSSRAELTLVGELFGLPIRAARFMSTSAPGDE